MDRTIWFALLGLLLLASLFLKVAGAGHAAVNDDPGNDDIRGTLIEHAFLVEMAAPGSDPNWIRGLRGDCELLIANVSPQGWHRQVVEWRASGKQVIYSFEGRTYPRQPIVKSIAAHYLVRLASYVGIIIPPVKVRAAIVGPTCPDELARSMLGGLS